LRSGDNRNPFPEEVNRRFVSLIAKYHFCPTNTAKNNLLSESADPAGIFVTGNTVVDTFNKTLNIVRKTRPKIKQLKDTFTQKPFALITGHRRENFGSGIKNVCLTIKALAKKHPNFNWLWSLHLNPNAREVVFETLKDSANVKLTEPFPYRAFVYLMDKAEFIISDSGGVQEEAPSIGKTVLVTRVCTERPEALNLGTSILVGTSPDKIKKEVARIIKGKPKKQKTKNPFGDGKAAERIIDIIVKGNCEEFR